MRVPNDSVWAALEILGDRWTFLVLREAFFGVRRFEGMRRNLGIARNILSNRLRMLVDRGILVRRKYQERPDRFEYRLTEKGLDFYPVILALMDWGDRWVNVGKGPPLVLYHEVCGRRIRPQVMCEHCGTEIKPRDVRYEERSEIGGPDGSKVRSGSDGLAKRES